MKSIIVALLLLTPLYSYGDNRTKVAVIDTGVNNSEFIAPYLCDSAHKDLTGYGLKDNHGHGSNIAYLISKNLNSKHECLVIIKWIDAVYPKINSLSSTSTVSIAINYARSIGVKYINLSLCGDEPNEDEHKALLSALFDGITVAIAAGNNGTNLKYFCAYYPPCYNIKHENLFVVANYIGSYRVPSSNFEGPVNAKEDGVNQGQGKLLMTGTSQSTAVFLGKLIKEREDKKYEVFNTCSTPNACRMRR